MTDPVKPAGNTNDAPSLVDGHCVQSSRRSSFRMPAEWETPECLWLAWPHNPQTWPGRFDSIPDFFVRWIHLVSESTEVRVIASGEALSDAKSRLTQCRGVELVDVPTNDCWLRDYGPTFVVATDGSVVGIDWKYNAWGGKYPPWDRDAAAAQAICDDAKIECVKGSLCLEGGALETDGLGRLLTTPQCLVTSTRNPGLTAQEVALELYRYLGVTEIVWVDGGGLVGDDTDGHIDQLARFVDPHNVVVATCSDPTDPNHLALETNFKQLQQWGEAADPVVNVHRLAIPPERIIDGQRVPESYCNFLWLGRQRLLVPTFGAETDDAALGLLADLTGADVSGIDCRDLAWGLGALHCASREQVAARSS